MKTKKIILNCFATVMAGVALTASVSQAQPTNLYFGPTGTNTDLQTYEGHWTKFDGDANQSITFDPAQDADGDPTSGSVYIQNTWPQPAPYFSISDNRGYWWGDESGQVDGSQYEFVVFDYKYDTNSTLTATPQLGVGRLKTGTGITSSCPLIRAPPTLTKPKALVLPAAGIRIGRER
jgi:hypothetical protein